MNVTFTDFYGQQVNISDETASGNIRLKVSTCKNLNEVRTKPISDYDLETDISLTQQQVAFLIETLKMMQEEE